MALRPGKKHGPCKGKGCSECDGRGWMFPPAKPRKAIRSKALGRAEEDAEYARLRKKFLQMHPICLVLGPNGPCRQPTTQIHHRRRRGPFYLAVETWMATCHQCHELIERNGRWARAMAYSWSPHTIRPMPPISTTFIPYDGPYPD